MTLDEMKAQFTSLMNRRDLTANTALVSTFMDQAIMRVQRELRVPAMEKTAAVTITSDYSGLVIPNDLIEVKEIRPDGYDALSKDTLDHAYRAAKVPGVPQIYSRDGGVWILGPAPSTGDVVKIKYYAELPALVNGTDENVMSKIAWDLFVNAACVYAAQHFTDKRKGGFEATYQTIKQDLQDQADADDLGDDAVVAPALVYPPDDFTDIEVI